MSDLLNKAKSALSGGSSHSAGTSTQGQAGGQADGQQQDYLDKGLAAGQKKFGMPQNAQMNEQVTDGARGMYEKTTGSKVNPKFSN